MRCCLPMQARLEYRDAIEEHLSTANCIAVKFSAPLSRKKYQHLRHRLAYTWAEGKWVLNSFKGVDFPQLKSNYKIKTIVKEIKTKFGIQSLNAGNTTVMDLRHLLAVSVQEAVRSGNAYSRSLSRFLSLWFFCIVRVGRFTIENNKVVQEFGQDPEVQGLLDAALQHKGTKVCTRVGWCISTCISMLVCA